MAEPVAAVPELLRPEQAAQKYEEAVAVAVEKCAADTAGHTCYICMGPGDEEEGLVSGFCACRGGLGFAHVSCLARAAQVEVERDTDTGWARWSTCRQCEQDYHGVVRCALGWACWKTYVGRPEDDLSRQSAMSVLGNGLSASKQPEDALAVEEAKLSLLRRVGAPEGHILCVQGNLAITYKKFGRNEEALRLRQEVYSGRLKLNGAENERTFIAANNYADSLRGLLHFEEAKALLRRTVPTVRRVRGEGHKLTLNLRWLYARALYDDPSATLDDLREAVTTLEDTERTARRVLGGAHPTTKGIEAEIRLSRAALCAREAPVQGKLAQECSEIAKTLADTTFGEGETPPDCVKEH